MVLTNWGTLPYRRLLSPTHNVLQIPSVLCLWLCPCEIFPFHVCISIGTILVQVTNLGNLDAYIERRKEVTILMVSVWKKPRKGMIKLIKVKRGKVLLFKKKKIREL